MKRYYRKLRAKKEDGQKIIQIDGIPLRISLQMLRQRVAVQGAMSRMQTNKYEAVLRMQRNTFYQNRRKIMMADDLKERVERYLHKGIEYYLNEQDRWDSADLLRLVNDHISYEVLGVKHNLKTKKEIEDYLLDLCHEVLKQKAKVLINDEQLTQFYRTVILHAMDGCWIDQMDYLSSLKMYVDKWPLAGYNSDFIYQQRAFNSFEKMIERINCMIVDNLLLSPIYLNEKNQLVVVFN